MPINNKFLAGRDQQALSHFCKLLLPPIFPFIQNQFRARASMTPLMFESLLFLRVNERFCNLETVIEALAIAKANAKGERLKRKIADESVMETFVEDLDDDHDSDDLDDSDDSDEETTNK
jgi:hypothetical protein